MESTELELESESSSKCLTFLYVIWKFFKCIFSHVTLVSLVVAYCVLGALAFEILEAEHEREVKRSIKDIRGNVTEDLWSMTQTVKVLRRENWTRDVVEKLKAFETDLLLKMKKEGWDGTENIDNIQWTFAGALFYSIIVITTIGYGHISPKTRNGKVVTIFYAILGIPLMLLCLSNIGDVMASSFRFLYWKICCYVCTRPPKPRRVRSNNMIRGYSIRQGSGRSGSARAASLRRSIRASQRSADSALGLSESIARSTQLDLEPRYQASRRYDIDGNPNDSPKRSATLPNTASPRNLQIIHSSRHTYDNRCASTTPRSGRARIATTTISGATQSLDRRLLVTPNDIDRTSVLFNKYALDEPDFAENKDEFVDELQLPPRINITRSNISKLENTLPRATERPTNTRRCHSVEPGTTNDRSTYIEMARPRRIVPGVRRPRSNLSYTSRVHKREAPSPRIMSPMGFAVHRQVYADDIEFDEYLTAVEEQTIKPVPIWLCVFLVVSYILGGAVLFTEWEKWIFLDSAYFCFITLTTIGFGDFVPAHRLNAHQGIALCSLYLLFGIALLAMSFNLVQEEVITNVKSVAKRLGIIKEEEDNDDDEDDYYNDVEAINDDYDVENYDCEYPDVYPGRRYLIHERDLERT
ncbi:uncharacterized protein [Chelonus insularis]|uniref:uncharacterized protein n=1 Tax=Chelonus insularis TaxID=460826 RepID=UPI00158CF82C|nr:uncharacterized protein LOC118069392 [Chelonus insularis]